MKKVLFVILAILCVSGMAYGAGIPSSVDPQNGPEIWTQEVFNDSGSTLTSGTAVVWDYTDSDMYDLDLRKMYITTTTTVDDIATAGVTVDPSIANQTVGTICIYGPVRCLTAASATVTAGTAIGTSATAGKVGSYSNTSADDACIGWSVDANTVADSVEGGGNIMVLFVNPSVQAD